MRDLSWAVSGRRNSHKPDVQRISGSNFMVRVNAPAGGLSLGGDLNSQHTVAVALGANVIDRNSGPRRPDRIGIVLIYAARVWTGNEAAWRECSCRPPSARLQGNRRSVGARSAISDPCSQSHSLAGEAHGLHQLQIESFTGVYINVLTFHRQDQGQSRGRASSAASQYTRPGDHAYARACHGAAGGD